MAKITLKGNPVHTSGNLPEIGSKISEFTLVDASLKEKNLKDYSGKKLIYFVPSLDTPTCAISTKKFLEALSAKGITALIISMDLPFAQKRVCESFQKGETLSLMRTKDFAKECGVLIVDGPLNGLTARAVLVLDENNTLLYGELVSEIASEPNYEKALSFL